MLNWNFLSGNSNVNQAARETGVSQRVTHRLVAAGRVNHYPWQGSPCHLDQHRQLGSVSLGFYYIPHAKTAFAKLKTRRAQVQDNGLRSADLHELQCRQPNGSSSDHEHAFSSLRVRTVDRVTTDRQRL